MVVRRPSRSTPRRGILIERDDDRVCDVRSCNRVEVQTEHVKDVLVRDRHQDLSVYRDFSHDFAKIREPSFAPDGEVTCGRRDISQRSRRRPSSVARRDCRAVAVVVAVADRTISKDDTSRRVESFRGQYLVRIFRAGDVCISVPRLSREPLRRLGDCTTRLPRGETFRRKHSERCTRALALVVRGQQELIAQGNVRVDGVIIPGR
mmetsp:Transcript_6531/g.24003  ORF Transcript_6531/g.24003 Transcript_6531/m.24003 type:complete len:206 (+) Transcript_6531:1678-2295(+)